MKEIIRIDKKDGSETVESDLSRVHQTINVAFLPDEQESVLQEFKEGLRRVQNDFAIYEMREVEGSI